MFRLNTMGRVYRNEVTDGDDGSSAVTQEVTEKPEDPKKEEAPKISDSEAKLLKEVMQKKNRIKELETELSSFKTKISEFDGIDPNEVRALLKDRADAEKAKLEAKGEWTALKEQMAKEHLAEKEKIIAEHQKLSEAMRQKESIIERLTLSHNFDTSSFIQNELVLTPGKARAIYGSHFDIDENGTVVGFDKPRGDNHRTPLVDGQGNPLSFEEALKRLVDADPDRDELLKAKRRPGSASSSTTRPLEPQSAKLRGYDKIAAALNQKK